MWQTRIAVWPLCVIAVADVAFVIENYERADRASRNAEHARIRHAIKLLIRHAAIRASRCGAKLEAGVGRAARLRAPPRAHGTTFAPIALELHP